MAPQWNLVKLAKLNAKVRRPVITGRLFKRWRAQNHQNGQLYGTDFVFIDQEGSAIEGTIDDENVDELETQLIEGKVYEVQNFTLNTQRENYKTVNHPFMLKFTPSTDIEMKEDTGAIPTTYFNFTEFENIVGKLTTMRPLQHIFSGGQNTQLREIELCNERGKNLQITLWEDLSTQITEDYVANKSEEEPIIIVFSSVRLTDVLNGVLKSYSATRMYVDGKIPCIDSIKSRYTATSVTVTPARQYRRQSENFANANFMPLAEILQKHASARTIATVKCIATIVDFYESEGWSYTGCPTHKKKLNSDGTCIDCKTVIGDPKICYRFMAFVRDDSVDKIDGADFLFFDPEGEKLMGYPATTLLVTHQASVKHFPSQILAQTDMKFDFTIRFNTSFSKRARKYFNVLDVKPHVSLPGQPLNYSEKEAGTSSIESVAAKLPAHPQTPVQQSNKRSERSKGKDITTNDCTIDEEGISPCKKRLFGNK